MLQDNHKMTICLLGMHRSGTSCLTGSLQAAGLYLGKHHTWNSHNPLGNRENPDIFDLHEDLLAANSGSWRTPPEKVIWADYHLDWARRIIAGFDRHAVWGFKDPRTLLTLSGWKSLLENVTRIGIFRHPLSVTKSLEERGKGIGLTKEKAFDLWAYYNRILLEEYHTENFPIFSFDWKEEYFHLKLNELCKNLGLRELKKEERFFVPTLRHHQYDSEENLPKEIKAIYKALNACIL